MATHESWENVSPSQQHTYYRMCTCLVYIVLLQVYNLAHALSLHTVGAVFPVLNSQSTFPEPTIQLCPLLKHPTHSENTTLTLQLTGCTYTGSLRRGEKLNTRAHGIQRSYTITHTQVHSIHICMHICTWVVLYDINERCTQKAIACTQQKSIKHCAHATQLETSGLGWRTPPAFGRVVVQRAPHYIM